MGLETYEVVDDANLMSGSQSHVTSPKTNSGSSIHCRYEQAVPLQPDLLRLLRRLLSCKRSGVRSQPPQICRSLGEEVCEHLGEGSNSNVDRAHATANVGPLDMRRTSPKHCRASRLVHDPVDPDLHTRACRPEPRMRP